MRTRRAVAATKQLCSDAEGPLAAVCRAVLPALRARTSLDAICHLYSRSKSRPWASSCVR